MSLCSIDLSNQVALVSGGSRGIGREIVLRLAEAGAQVVYSYVAHPDEANELLKCLLADNVQATAVQADVAHADEAIALVSHTVAQYGRLDIMVCNAGIWAGAPVEHMSEELWDRVLNVNLKGTWAMCRAAAGAMKKQRRGRILVVSSTAGQRGESHYSGYAAAKGGQISLVKSLAAELGAYGINVNALAPGWVETEMTASVLNDIKQRREIESSIPLGKVASTGDIAWPALFLCSEWASHITGEVLSVNGGAVLCG